MFQYQSNWLNIVSYVSSIVRYQRAYFQDKLTRSPLKGYLRSKYLHLREKYKWRERLRSRDLYFSRDCKCIWLNNAKMLQYQNNWLNNATHDLIKNCFDRIVKKWTHCKLFWRCCWLQWWRVQRFFRKANSVSEFFQCI